MKSLLKSTGNIEFLNLGGSKISIEPYEVYECDECLEKYWFKEDERAMTRYYELLHVLCGEEEIDIVTGEIVAN